MGPIPLDERLHICLDIEKLQKSTTKIIHNSILHLTDFKDFNIIFLIIHIQLLLHKWTHKLQMLKKTNELPEDGQQQGPKYVRAVINK